MTTPFTPITRFTITPSYAMGFHYAWEVSPSFIEPAPWVFKVQQAAGPAGPWTDVSPALTQVYRWAEAERRVVNKAEVLYFRVQLTTPQNQYVSDTIMPYGDLNKREYLLVRDIMRREVLHARTLGGVLNQLWLVSTFGPLCTVCREPITGEVRDSHCKQCFGTGRVPAYNGPYATWCVYINPTKRLTEMSGDNLGTRQPKDFQIRIIGTPPMKTNDVVVDSASDKRYYVDGVQVVSEIRRIPVVQVLAVREAPVSDPIYKVGAQE